MTRFDSISATRHRRESGAIEDGAAVLEIAGLGGGTVLAPDRPRYGAEPEPERFQVIVIGAGQAGLSVGYHLARRGISFVILDANRRVGDSWRKRWDSLRLFTPACYDSLDGMRFPAPRLSFPTKDEMADYLEAYAARFRLPVRNGVRVERLTRQGDKYLVRAGSRLFEAEHVVIAMSKYQFGKPPPFASELDPRIVQLHSVDYRRPSQLVAGDVLIAGAGNSGAEIAMELVRNGHKVRLAGRDPGHIPFRVESVVGRYLLIHVLLRFVFHRLLTVRTPMGRKFRAARARGGPLIRTKPKHLAAAGVERVPCVRDVRNGLPVVDDGRVLDVANVVWCTGFDPGFSWIDLPIFGEDGDPLHERGVVAGEPGLYFVGLPFIYAPTSMMVHGVGRDAAYAAKRIAERVNAGASGH